jgi:hypothetical protein
MMIIERTGVWHQFEKAINRLEEGIRECPDTLWESMLWADEPDQWVAAGFSKFWYLAYHTLFWLDLYLTGAEEGFMPPEPFDLVEMVDDEVLPRTYRRDEVLGYLQLCRQRCRETILNLTSEQSSRLCSFPWGQVTFGELLVYNLRHVEEHASYFSLFLGQQRGGADSKP